MQNIILMFLLLGSGSKLIVAQDVTSIVHLNQLGFYPESQKIAVISRDVDGEFIIKSLISGEIVYRSKLSNPQLSPFSSNVTRIANFSEFTVSGSYILELPGIGKSHTFKIKPHIFHSLTKSLIKAFYYQRMSTPILPEFSGKWSRKEGHPDKKVLIHLAAASPGRPAGSTISSPKGWYDAGDYNKYIVNSGITMGTLLSLYEDFPSYFDTLELKIPETGNGAPDLLNEIAWNLRWMVTMQDPADGGVYNKVTNANFDDFIMPAAAVAPRYLVPKSTAATLDFAAVMAQSARVYGKFGKVYPGLSDSCLKSAAKAWNWALKNPNISYDQNEMNKNFKPLIVTGGYGDREFIDEFLWAAAELFVTTGDSRYYTTQKIIPDMNMSLPSWNNVRLLGYYTLLRFEKKMTEQSSSDYEKLKSMIINLADNLAEGDSGSSYKTVMGRSAADFIWGSNSVAANQGILLIQAFKLTNNRKYVDFALTNLDYILGRNATGYSFITGYGHKTPMFPHHRLSEADGITDPIPGFIVGGPNPGQQDGCKTYPSRIPDESYTDDVCSYASNEIAINWNAPAAYLAGAIEALFNSR